MSIPRRVNASCNKCGETFEVTIWDSINTDMGPQLPKRLMSGEFFQITCPNCGETSFVEYPMLYNDMRHAAFIWLAPGEKARKDAESAMGISDAFGINTVRIVKNRLELAEKVTCLEYGRDDRLVEFCKLAFKGGLEEEHPEFVPEGSRYYRDGEKENFDYWDQEGNVWTCLFPEELYDEFSNHLRVALEKSVGSQSFVVDEQWVESFTRDNPGVFPI